MSMHVSNAVCGVGNDIWFTLLLLQLMDIICVQPIFTSGLLTPLCQKQNAYPSMPACLPDAAYSIHMHACSIRLDIMTILLMLEDEHPCRLD